MRTKVVIIGGKGAAVVVAEQIHDASLKGTDTDLLGFAFDDPAFGTEINGFPILCKTTEAWGRFGGNANVKFIFQLYRPDLMNERIALKDSYGIPLERFHTFIHPSAMISRSARIGHGCALMANTVVNPNAVLGNHCSVHSGSLIGHDSTMGDHNFIAAHVVLGSNCLVGNANFFGINSCFNNYLSIGDNCFVGMASNVVKSITNGTKVYGNPAKPFDRPVKPL